MPTAAAPQAEMTNPEVTQAKPLGRPLAQRWTSISTLLFYAGLISIPFDNLPFAPSIGWATISPIIFFLYVCFNLPMLSRVRFSAPFAIAVLVIIASQCINLFIYGITMDALLDALFTFTLGLFFYFALVIRYEQQKATYNKDATILYRAYVVAFVYGLVWMFANAFSSDILHFFNSIERRYYPRLAFSFTEPSFISIHVFGVLLLYTYFVSDRTLVKKMVVLGMLFILLAVLTKSSARAIVDAAVFLFLLLVRTTWVDREHSARNLMLWATIIGAGIFVLLSSGRIQSILVNGVNADGSMASRFFRIQGMFYGFLQDPVAMLFGYGPGNMIVPFREGYDQAFATYSNAYMREVNELGVADSIDNIYSMPIRLISDIGLIATIACTVVLFWLAKKKKIDLCVVLMTIWLYVQFDSLAFYALPLLLFLYRVYDQRSMGVSYFAFSDIFGRRKKTRQVRRHEVALNAEGARSDV